METAYREERVEEASTESLRWCPLWKVLLSEPSTSHGGDLVVVKTPMLGVCYYGEGVRKADVTKLLHGDCTNKSAPIW